MAKVTGALFSMDASGGFGGALVFGKWKGRQTVRQLVTPANPKSADQETARNMVRTAGAAQHYANISTDQFTGAGMTTKAYLQANAPAGQAWNGFLVKSMIGGNGVHYAAAKAIWDAFSSGEKTAWEDAAAGATPDMPAAAQKSAGGASTTALTAGRVYLHYVYGCYIAGMFVDPPNATPPTLI